MIKGNMASRPLKVLNVVNVAALRAQTRHVDDDVMNVETGEVSYRFDAASLASDDGDSVVKPDDLLATQSGRWFKRGSLASGGPLTLFFGGNAGTTNRAFAPFGHPFVATVTQGQESSKINSPRAGTIKNLRVRASGVQAAGATYTVEIYIGGLASGVKVVLDENNSFLEDLVNTAAVAKDQTIEVYGTETGVAINRDHSIFFEIE